MSGTVYPSGTQLLRIPTTILLPSAATPFNPSAINPSVEQCWDSIKALESYGIFKSTFDNAQPPYPSGGSFVNSGTYKFGTTSQTKLEFSASKTYRRAARPFAKFDSSYWKFGYQSVVTNASAHTQTDVATTGDATAAVFEFDLPSLITLEKAIVAVEPKNTHASLPGTMPKLQIYLHSRETGVGALVAEQADTSATHTDYNLPHEIEVNLSSTAYDPETDILTARFLGESGGAGAIVDLVVLTPMIEFKRARIGEEFGALVP